MVIDIVKGKTMRGLLISRVLHRTCIALDDLIQLFLQDLILNYIDLFQQNILI